MGVSRRISHHLDGMCELTVPLGLNGMSAASERPICAMALILASSA